MAFTHGTSYGYNRMGCRCMECCLYRKEQQKKRITKLGYGTAPEAGLKHGTATGYQYYKCRCTECSAANAVYQKAYRNRKRKAS